MLDLYDTRTRPAITFADLRSFGDRPALVTGDGELSYADLAARVEQTADALGDVRRLVLIAGSNDIDPIVTYLAAVAGGHVTLLVPGDNTGPLDALVDAYDPDVVFASHDTGWQLRERREDSAHDLHPDLALLLSTSGSTGSPKLVRLSHQNLRSNAESIADYLSIAPTDRAATSLPVHYCYGLSVINSHLLSGAGLVLTDASVVDPCFWELFSSAGATTFARRPTPSTCSTSAVSRISTSRGCATSPRPVGGWPRQSRAVRRTGARAWLGLLRDVRTNRGDCPDGLSAA